MRQAGLQGSGVQTFSKATLRGLRLAVVVLGTSLVMSSHAVRADDDDDEPERSVMDNIMSTIGARPAGDTGIQYRERSPLVVPSKIALPPPPGKKSNAANWPKDPDEIARREAIEAAKKGDGETTLTPNQMQRALMPSELAAPKSYRKRSPNSDDVTPGYQGARALSPSELGYKGGLFGDMFKMNKAEDTPFKGEPARETLAQPPVGYQTPSPKYKYGTGPADAVDTEYNPAAGKYGGK